MPLITGTLLDDALVLTTGGSLDTLTGLAGNDVILVALPGDLAAGDKIDGGTGYDRLWFTSTNVNDTLSLVTLVPLTQLVTGVESVQIVDAVGNTSGTTEINLSAAGMTTGLVFTGNDGANSITGSAGADTIIGNGGVDNIFGGLGKDRIVTTAAQVVLADDMDQINAGALTEGNTLALVGPVSADVLVLDDVVAVDLAAAGDQVTVFARNGRGYRSRSTGGPRANRFCQR